MNEDEINYTIAKYRDPKYEVCSGTHCSVKTIKYTRSLDKCIPIIDKLVEEGLNDDDLTDLICEMVHYFKYNEGSPSLSLTKAIVKIIKDRQCN